MLPTGIAQTVAHRHTSLMAVASDRVHPAVEEMWDAVVVGTGMGGSTVGYELARRGRRVLFLEKGRFLHDSTAASAPPSVDVEPWVDTRLRAGRWPWPLEGRTSFSDVRFDAPRGCGTGGSTTLYGAQLERFTAADFTPRANFPGVADANLPDEWPIGYETLLPYYRAAESLYRVRGTPDPLSPDPEAQLGTAPRLSQRDQALLESFRGLGLHPYQSHVGYDYDRGCQECMAFCPRGCKSDAAAVCLVPALAAGRATLLDECDVVELSADRAQVTAVNARWRGRDLTLRGRVVVLAAGALMTPALLLRSGRPAGGGLANRSGQVGRNLMLHTSDFLAVHPGATLPADGPSRALALNDFYAGEAGKLGAFQSLGLPALTPDLIRGYLEDLVAKDPRWWRTATQSALGLIARAAPVAVRGSAVFATIVEDLPYLDNRVVLDPGATNGLRFEYRYTPELLERNRRFRRLIARTLSPRHRVTVLTGTRNNLNYGHVCGTCRFGRDPDTSVLDPSNRAHDLDNLYVVDASFFPSSGGTNPSLTIAANALRVAEIVDGRLG